MLSVSSFLENSKQNIEIKNGENTAGCRIFQGDRGWLESMVSLFLSYYSVFFHFNSFFSSLKGGRGR